MDYETSFWESDTLLDSYDLIIIGAGIVGLSTALLYKDKNPDARVGVLERGFLPMGASTRNAGFACIGSISEHLADIKKESVHTVQQRMVRRYRGLSLLKQTLGEEAIGYEQCGGYELFTARKQFETSSQQMGRINEWLQELLGEPDVYREERMQNYPVICNRLEGALHPGKMMQALIEKAGRSGAELKWNSPVEKVNGDEIHIAGGPVLKAGKILFAANGFVRRLLPDMEVFPARGLVFITNKQEDLPWKGIFHHDRGYIYFRNVGERLLIGGARNLDAEGEETDRFGTNKYIKNHLVAFVSDVLKLPVGWHIEQQWSGIMGFTSTKTPIVKQIDTHQYIAAGLSGMGIAIGMEIAREASELLAQ